MTPLWFGLVAGRAQNGSNGSGVWVARFYIMSFPVTPTRRTFTRLLPYKWEEYCSTVLPNRRARRYKWRCTPRKVKGLVSLSNSWVSVRIGGVLQYFPLEQWWLGFVFLGSFGPQNLGWMCSRGEWVELDVRIKEGKLS